MMENKKLTAKILPNGPILVEGTFELTMSDKSVVTKENPHFCRCGFSKNKPYCDGFHAKEGWKE